MGLNHLVKPLLLATHDLNVGGPVDIIVQGLDRLPERQVHDLVRAEIIDASGIAIFGL